MWLCYVVQWLLYLFCHVSGVLKVPESRAGGTCSCFHVVVVCQVFCVVCHLLLFGHLLFAICCLPCVVVGYSLPFVGVLIDFAIVFVVCLICVLLLFAICCWLFFVVCRCFGVLFVFVFGLLFVVVVCLVFVDCCLLFVVVVVVAAAAADVIVVIGVVVVVSVCLLVVVRVSPTAFGRGSNLFTLGWCRPVARNPGLCIKVSPPRCHVNCQCCDGSC